MFNSGHAALKWPLLGGGKEDGISVLQREEMHSSFAALRMTKGSSCAQDDKGATNDQGPKTNDRRLTTDD